MANMIDNTLSAPVRSKLAGRNENQLVGLGRCHRQPRLRGRRSDRVVVTKAGGCMLKTRRPRSHSTLAPHQPPPTPTSLPLSKSNVLGSCGWRSALAQCRRAGKLNAAGWPRISTRDIDQLSRRPASASGSVASIGMVQRHPLSVSCVHQRKSQWRLLPHNIAGNFSSASVQWATGGLVVIVLVLVSPRPPLARGRFLSRVPTPHARGLYAQRRVDLSQQRAVATDLARDLRSRSNLLLAGTRVWLVQLTRFPD